MREIKIVQPLLFVDRPAANELLGLPRYLVPLLGKPDPEGKPGAMSAVMLGAPGNSLPIHHEVGNLLQLRARAHWSEILHSKMILWHDNPAKLATRRQNICRTPNISEQNRRVPVVTPGAPPGRPCKRSPLPAT
jgi:hypothetical protein